MRKKIGLAFALISIFLLLGSNIALGTPEKTTPDAKSISKHHQKCAHKELMLKNMSEILGIDSQELKDELKAGKTIKDLAHERGIDEATLIKKLESKIEERLDQKVKDGKITKEKADSIKSKLPEKLSKVIDKKWDKKDSHKGYKKEVFKGVRDQVQQSLNIKSDELKAELETGKSLAQIAQDKNINSKELKAAIQKTIEQNLDQLVKEQKMSAEKAEKIREKLPERLEEMMQRTNKEHK